MQSLKTAPVWKLSDNYNNQVKQVGNKWGQTTINPNDRQKLTGPKLKSTISNARFGSELSNVVTQDAGCLLKDIWKKRHRLIFPKENPLCTGFFDLIPKNL
jgi:hypothetical protein